MNNNELLYLTKGVTVYDFLQQKENDRLKNVVCTICGNIIDGCADIIKADSWEDLLKERCISYNILKEVEIDELDKEIHKDFLGSGYSTLMLARIPHKPIGVKREYHYNVKPEVGVEGIVKIIVGKTKLSVNKNGEILLKAIFNRIKEMING